MKKQIDLRREIVTTHVTNAEYYLTNELYRETVNKITKSSYKILTDIKYGIMNLLRKV